MERLVIGKHGAEAEQPSPRASWNTPHPMPRSGMSYGGRMALSFAMTSLVTVVILALVVTVVWGGAFSDYTRANVEEIAQVAAEKLAERYEDAGEWSVDAIKTVAESSTLSDDIGMQVKDAGGAIMYDDTWPAAAMASTADKSDGRSDTRSPVSKAPTDPESAVVAPSWIAMGARSALSVFGCWVVMHCSPRQTRRFASGRSTPWDSLLLSRSLWRW